MEHLKNSWLIIVSLLILFHNNQCSKNIYRAIAESVVWRRMTFTNYVADLLLKPNSIFALWYQYVFKILGIAFKWTHKNICEGHWIRFDPAKRITHTYTKQKKSFQCRKSEPYSVVIVFIEIFHLTNDFRFRFKNEGNKKKS